MLPMLALAAEPKVVSTLIDDDRYIFTQKMDGRRLLVEFKDGKMTGYNRSGDRVDIAHGVATCFRNSPLMEGHFILDGEMVKTSERNGHLFLFDMPRAGELILPTSPYEHRITALEELASRVVVDERAGISVLPVAKTGDEKHRLLRSLLAAHAEGLIIRRRDGVYAEGRRTADLLKVKFTKTADCVVIEMGRDGKDNLVLGCHDDQGNMVEVGIVSALTGDGGAAVLGSVVEVTYLSFTPGGRLLQPVTPRLRFDKPASECSLSQFHPVDMKSIEAV